VAFEIWRKKERKKNNLQGLPDEELIRLYQETTDMLYVSELFVRYTHLVYGLCLKYLNNEDQSKDAVMHIFEKIIKSLLTQNVSFFKSWLYILAKNHCLAQIKQQKRFEGEDIIFLENSEIFVEYQPEMHLNNEADKTDEEKLQVALSQLNTDQRICIELFYLHDKSYKEIAETTNLSLNNVKSYIQNGKRNLKQILGALKSILW